jgi:hypothetical protein
VELYDIISAVAAYFDGKTPDNFVINDVDLGLIALNQVRMQAELDNDFNFTRKLLQLEIDGVTGGSLDDATIYGSDDCKVEIKSIVDVGQFDTDGNFVPVDWDTTQASLNTQRQDNARTFVRYPTDGQAVCGPIGRRRFRFTGNKAYVFPLVTNTTFTIGIEAYTFTKDWPSSDSQPADENSKVWLSKGAQYLQWQTVIHLNQLYKHFVFRQEGNLPPPQDLANTGLATLVNWDARRFDMYRRHSR